MIYEVQSPYSYVVEFADGSRRILHANHLRKFYTRAQSLIYNMSLLASTNSCAIINDGDDDFGEIAVPDLTDECKQVLELPSQIIDRSTLAHLKPKQQQELSHLLDKYADCFSDIPGLTVRAEYFVVLMLLLLLLILMIVHVNRHVVNDLGVEHPIAFFSSKLIPAQRNLATIEREAYAVLVAVNKFKHWFFGSKVTIHSDHNPLTYLTESAPKSSKLMRWSLALAEFNIEFKYKA